MLSFPPGIQVFMAIAPVDMRKSFDGLSAAVQSVFDRDVLDGHLFLFLNKRRDRIKVLWWDNDGLAIFAKRLERGTYEIPRHDPDTQQLRLEATQLALLLSGVQLDAPQRRRYARTG
jgi:transposase